MYKSPIAHLDNCSYLYGTSKELNDHYMQD